MPSVVTMASMPSLTTMKPLIAPTAQHSTIATIEARNGFQPC